MYLWFPLRVYSIPGLFPKLALARAWTAVMKGMQLKLYPQIDHIKKGFKRDEVRAGAIVQ